MTGAIPGNLPLWFLLSLFVCRVLLNVRRVLSFSLYLIATIGLLVVLSLHVVGYVYPCYFANMMSGLFFMSMGAIIGDRKLTPQYVICVIIYLVSLLYPSFVGIRSNHLYYGIYLCWFVYSLCGILIVNDMVSRAIFKASPLKYIGRHSMEINCWHWIVLIFI